METEDEHYQYEDDPEYRLNTSDAVSYLELAVKINKNNNIQLVMLQHEFGFFNETPTDYCFFFKIQKKISSLLFTPFYQNRIGN